jgi:dnd system-associated protein 4
MARNALRNVNRSEKYEASIVQKLVNDPDGKNVFPTIRELLCFAAMLGYALGKKIKFPENFKKNDVSWAQFVANDSDDYIYFIAVCDTKSTDCLKSNPNFDLVDVFEEYINGGFEVISTWFLKYSNQNCLKAIISGLYDEGFIDNQNIDRESIMKSISF